MLVVLLILHAVLCAHSHGLPGAAVPVKQCPSACQCEEDGIFLLVDCSEQGLHAVPIELNPLTSYLDLSMNNISEIQTNAFHNLHFLSELRLSGNHLRHIPGPMLQGLYNLKVLMLQNNQLERLPSEAPWELPNLLSLRLDANLIVEVPARTFSGMRSLRHLWLDDNALTEIPVSALNDLSSLQAMTLALNRITHIPDYAFRNLSNLVVLHLHNNMIRTLGQNCFEGLHSLETLELNFNDLQEFPVAIRTLAKLQELGFHNNNIKAIPERAFVGNPLLQTIHFYENPIQFVGKSAFQFLPKLHTLSLNGATEIREFPDLKGTTSLQVLTLTRAGLTGLPYDLCHLLPKLRVLELSHNLIEELPSFHHCASLQEIGLQHNLIKQIEMNTFQQLNSLRSLDLTGNQLNTLPLVGLTSLTHLKLKGNLALSHSFREEDLPNIRVIEMPYAYQCCVFGACNSYKAASQWEDQTGNEEEDLQKKALSLFPIHTDNNYDLDLEEFQLAIEESKLQTSIQCTPIPGPFKPCDNLFDSWVVRLGMWLISLVSLMGNSFLLVTVFASPSYLSPVKFIIGTISGANLLTGLCTGTLALVDAQTFGAFALHGAQWEMGAGCQATGFLSVLASEGSILFLTLAAVQCSVSVSCVRAYGKSPSLGSVQGASVACLLLSLAVAALPLIGIGEYGATPLCMPSPLPDGEPSTLGFMVALIMMNSLCFLVITGTYIKLYWDLMKGDFDSIWDCAMIKHVAWLIFTNCLLYCPTAFLTFFSLLGLFPVNEEVVKSVVLVLLPLPASINPLLYLLFNPHFREDVRLLLSRPHIPHDSNLDSFVSVDTEKSSYDSTQALVSIATEADAVFEGSSVPAPETVARDRFSCPPLIPCQLLMKPSTERENAGENMVRSTPGLSAKEMEHPRSSGMDTHNGTSFSGIYHSPLHSSHS
ncbi:leucine-rich repeat-containing G-protein coupled receptor 6 isoform X2 [Myxocyprinus asiaticus]|uniref:leucine-rich repeat-containing G-protein coupled receptor 6 isoform X2 n=1 Tax=Myxocyprinus asiaticus TaxID=70543 RepID=UPI0022230C94|nr:leucine-rich repeat-containing G-protein coupled receptor 6 isoform X2 [Myxocyprinus asiaticus]